MSKLTKKSESEHFSRKINEKLSEKTRGKLVKPPIRRLNIGPLVEDNMVILSMELKALRAKALKHPLDSQDMVKFEKLSKVLVSINKEDREERKLERLDQLSDDELQQIIDGTLDEEDDDA